MWVYSAWTTLVGGLKYKAVKYRSLKNGKNLLDKFCYVHLARRVAKPAPIREVIL
jgi:hypothetical protein